MRNYGTWQKDLVLAGLVYRIQETDLWFPMLTVIIKNLHKYTSGKFGAGFED